MNSGGTGGDPKGPAQTHFTFTSSQTILTITIFISLGEQSAEIILFINKFKGCCDNLTWREIQNFELPVWVLHLQGFSCRLNPESLVRLQQALCAPSRNSLLTSRRPDSLHLYDFYSYWRDSVGNFTTLPQLLKENGYYTQSVGKIFHPGISSNFTDDALYSWSGKPFHPKTDAYKESKVCVSSDGQLARNLICPVIVKSQPGGTLPDLESLVAASEFLDNKDKITGGKPYFLGVGFHKPHVPLKFPVEYLGVKNWSSWTGSNTTFSRFAPSG